MRPPLAIGWKGAVAGRRPALKLVPFTTFRTALPALALVVVNVTNALGPAAQLSALTLVLLCGCRDLRFDRRGLPLLLYAGLGLFVAFVHYGSHQAVVKGAKLLLFCLASCLSVRGAMPANHFPAILALRAFLVACAANVLYALATGREIFRGDYMIEFSIYSSYTLGFLIHLARGRLTLMDRLAAYGFCVLCGSTMGLFVMLLGEVLGRRLTPWGIVGAVTLLPAGWFGLGWLMEIRGKEMSLEYLRDSDRGMILTTFFDVVLPSFSLQDWVLGKGIGTPFHQFVSVDPVFDRYLKMVGEGEIYAFCLHNEPLRLLCDYGLIGLTLVLLRLWSNCSKPVLIMLAICMMTNSYLYSFSGALIASSLLNVRQRKTNQGCGTGRGRSPATAAEEPDKRHLCRCQ